MAKRISTPAPPVPDEFRREYQSKFAPIPCEPNFKRGIERLPDEVAGRLLKAILEHTVSGSTEPPQDMDAFAFDMLLSKVDEFLEYGLENSWKRQYRARSGSESRWGKEAGAEPESPRKNALACQSKPKHANNNVNVNDNVNANKNINSNPCAQARREESKGMTVELRRYLSDAEEDGLVEVLALAGGLFDGVLEKWVLSDTFNAADTLEEKGRKLLQFKADLEAQAEAEAEAAELTHAEEEKEARLAKYPRVSAAALTAQQLAQYFEDTGRAVDAEVVERIYQGIKAAVLRDGVANWRKYANTCLDNADKKEPQEPQAESGQNW